MATLTQRVLDLATATGTKLKELHVKIGDLASLPLTNKTTVTAAMLEIIGDITTIEAEIEGIQAAAGAQIDDAATTSAVKTWSIDKQKVELQALKDSILGGAGAALDTLQELAAALGNDPNLASTLATDIGKRIRFDAAQALTAGEKTQARANMGAQSADEIGFADNNFVTTLNAAMA